LSSGLCLKCNLFDFILISNVLPFYSPRVLSLKRIGPHNINILNILIGSLLGDGSMERDLTIKRKISTLVFQDQKNKCTDIVI
jgi:hypothetical protein